ncbi:MAG: hypothetical protein IIC57_06040 [Proteobacteria bacterium]|nr:hypothetical protein [Pseudomonadota bacterium]
MSWQHDALWLVIVEPVTNPPDGGINLVVVRADIQALNVGNKFMVSITFLVENQANFLFLATRPIFLCGKKYTELKGHIEAW